MGHRTDSAAGLSPVRWAAACVLGGASLLGMGWTMATRAPAPQIRPPRAIVTTAIPAREHVHDPLSPGSYPALPARASRSEPGDATAVLPRTQPQSLDPSTQTPALGPPPAAVPLLININTASRAELELLPRIGPTLAQRIIEFRDAEGPIGSLQRLQDVKGIGERTAARLGPYIRFE